MDVTPCITDRSIFREDTEVDDMKGKERKGEIAKDRAAALFEKD